MAKIVLILGESGSGKTASLRNFKQGEIGIINVSKKPLPFKEKLPTIDTDNYAEIERVLKNAKTQTIVIDDSQYLMAFEFMKSANIKGYDKYTSMGLNFYNLVQTAVNDVASDKIVYFMAHTETDNFGNIKMKTIGKMLDEKITLEGLFTIVLKTFVQDGKYMFSTKTSGSDTVKTPIGMFEEQFIENDLKAVDEIIRNYYQINEKKKVEETKQ